MKTTMWAEIRKNVFKKQEKVGFPTILFLNCFNFVFHSWQNSPNISVLLTSLILCSPQPYISNIISSFIGFKRNRIMIGQLLSSNRFRGPQRWFVTMELWWPLSFEPAKVLYINISTDNTKWYFFNCISVKKRFSALSAVDCKVILILQGVPKKIRLGFCLISRQPSTGFSNRFFLLKTEIHT